MNSAGCGAVTLRCSAPCWHAPGGRWCRTIYGRLSSGRLDVPWRRRWRRYTVRYTAPSALLPPLLWALAVVPTPRECGPTGARTPDTEAPGRPAQCPQTGALCAPGPDKLRVSRGPELRGASRRGQHGERLHAGESLQSTESGAGSDDR